MDIYHTYEVVTTPMGNISIEFFESPMNNGIIFFFKEILKPIFLFDGWIGIGSSKE